MDQAIQSLTSIKGDIDNQVVEISQGGEFGGSQGGEQADLMVILQMILVMKVLMNLIQMKKMVNH